MAQITKLEQKTFQGKPTGFIITLDDERTGNLQEKQSDTGLKVGDSVIVTEIPYTSKAGKTSTLYGLKRVQITPASPTPPEQPSKPHNPTGLYQQQTAVSTAKANATIKAMEFLVDMFIADKVTWDQIQPKHKELTGYLNDAIDDCIA
jgi:hypothetical protein